MPSRDETQQMIEEEASVLQTQIESIEYECDTRLENVEQLIDQSGEQLQEAVQDLRVEVQRVHCELAGAVGPCSADSQVTLLTMSMYGSPTQMKTLEDICEDLVVQHHSSPLLMVHH